MMDVHEHRRVLSLVRETRGRALGSHREELSGSRRAWQRERQARPALHRLVLDGERREMREMRRVHKTALAQNRWILALAGRLQERLKKAG